MPRPDDVLEITVAEMRAAIRKARRAAYRKGEATATSFLKAVAKLNGSAAPLLKGLSDPPPAPTSDDATDPHAALYEALLGAVIDARESGDNDAVAGLVEAYRDHLDDPETLAAALSEPSGRGDGSLSKSSAAAVARVLLKAHEWRLLKAGKYDENKHPRDDHGRFVSRDAIADAKGDPAKEEALRDKVTDPEQREKLDNALAGTTDLGRTKAGQRKHEAGQRREKRAASHARAAELADKIAAGEATPEDMHELGDHLEGLTVDKLRALQSRIPTAGRTRRKAEMVAALRDSLEKSAHLKRVTDGAAGVAGRGGADPARLALAGLLPNRYDVTTADGEVVKAGTGYQRFEGQGKPVGYTAAQAAQVAAGVTPDHADRRIAEHERAASAPGLDDVQREYHATIADQLRGHKESVFGGDYTSSDLATKQGRHHQPTTASDPTASANGSGSNKQGATLPQEQQVVAVASSPQSSTASPPVGNSTTPAPVAGLTDDELRAEQAALPRPRRTVAQGERDREIARELARRNPLPAGGGTPVMMGGGKGPGHNGEDSAGAAMLGSPKPADPATAHAATLPEGSPARAAIEAALANGRGDKRRTLKELGHRHAEMAAQMSPDEERGYVEMMAAHGVKPLHEPGQTVPFDPETMQSDAGISTGTPVKVTRRGWTGLYGDERVGHENIGNNVQRAQVEPAGKVVGAELRPGKVSDLPPNVASKINGALSVLRRHQDDRRKSIEDTEIVSGEGKGTFDETAAATADAKHAAAVKAAHETLQTFRGMATKNGIDPESVIQDAGGIPADGIETLKKERAAARDAEAAKYARSGRAEPKPAPAPVPHPHLDTVVGHPRGSAEGVFGLSERERFELAAHLDKTTDPGILAAAKNGENIVPRLVASAESHRPQYEAAKQAATTAEREKAHVEREARHAARVDNLHANLSKMTPENRAEVTRIMTSGTKKERASLIGSVAYGHKESERATTEALQKLVASPTPPASATVGTPPEAKPVAATPKAAKPAPPAKPVAATPAPKSPAAMPLHANGLPDVKAGASQKPDDPAYQAAGRALLADDGFRKDLADAYNHQRLFVEHRDGLIPLDRVYHELAKRRPGVTVDQLHAAVDHLSRERGVEMHALNEIAKVPADERIATISRNDRNYHFMRFPGGADAEKMKPAKAAKPPAPAKPTPARQPKVAPASGYGQSGADHPLGQTDADHYRSLGDAIAAHGGYGGKFPAGGTEDDPLGHGAAGFPAGVDRAAFVTDVRGVVGRSQVARAVGASFPELYATVGKKYGMSKHDFARAMHDVDESREPGLRASGWSRMLTDMPEPGLATMNRGKVMHYIQPTGAGTADLEAMAGEGDTSLNVDHPEVRKRFGGGAPSPEPTAAPAAAADPTAELAKLERIPFGKHTKEQRKRLAELRAAPAP